MTRDEVLLFKQQDSDRTRPGRSCFHTAFRDRTARLDAPPRESIEVRAVAFFPDHLPNSCPKFDPTPATKVADYVLLSLDVAPFWPLMAKWYFRWTMRKSNGLSVVTDFLLQDPGNRMNLRNIPDDTRAAAKSLVLKDPHFVSLVRDLKSRLEAAAAAGRKRMPWTWWFHPSTW